MAIGYHKVVILSDSTEDFLLDGVVKGQSLII